MPDIQDIFKEYYEEYKSKHIVSSHQDKAIQNIINCRTENMGIRVQECEDCSYEQTTYCSCRNRNCPTCQTFVKEVWINDRKVELINTQYFHTIFTVPTELESIFLGNKELMYKMLFKSVSETLLELGADDKHVGGQIGALLIIHTWSQNLLFHPHIHCLIPGGALKNNKWKNCKKDFFISSKVLSKSFKKKFLTRFEKAFYKNEITFSREDEKLNYKYFFNQFKDELYSKSWYSFCRETFDNPEAVIEYLGRYTHRIAISNNRVIKVEDGFVWFKWRDNKDGGKQKIMKLTCEEFIRRYLLHILPKGFVKIRYIGVLSNRNKKTKLKTCQIATKLNESKKSFKKLTTEEILLKITKGKAFTCPCCGSQNFKFIGVRKNINFNNSS